MLKLKMIKGELTKMQCLFKLKQNGACEAGNVISKLYMGQAAKNGSVNCSADPLGAYRDEELANKEI